MSKKNSIKNDFKTFITRGNVVDMAVGVIVGGAFTAIVNSLGNNILRPLVNWILVLILGKDSLSEVYTFLQVAYKKDDLGNQIIDLEESIYIDWGAFANAIINFFVIAVVLFVIVKMANKLRDINEGIRETTSKAILDFDEINELKANNISLRDRKAVESYFAEKERLAKEKAEKEKAEAEALKAQNKQENLTSEELLKEIRDILKNKQ